MALELFPEGIIPEKYSLLVAKFIKKFVRHYVNHIIKPNTSEYDLKLEFKKEGMFISQATFGLLS